MKILRQLFLIILASAPALAMEMPQQRVLPPEIIRHLIIPFVAEDNTVRVMETIYSLNATNRFFRQSIQSEPVILALLQRIPLTANAIYIAKNNNIFKWWHLENSKYTAFKQWVLDANASLENGWEINMAAEVCNLELLPKLLNQRNIDLYARPPGGDGPLCKVVQPFSSKALKMLLDAGFHPDFHYKAALSFAIIRNATQNVASLLEAGADPFSNNLEDDKTAPEIVKLLLEARVKRKKRMLELLGKAGKAQEK